MKLEDIGIGVSLAGIEPTQVVSVVATVPLAEGSIQLIYRTPGQLATIAATVFEDTLRYLYMPRFKSRDVLAQAIRTGATSRDFFGTAYGQSGDTFDGFQLATGSVIFDDTLLLIEPVAAAVFEASRRAALPPTVFVVGDAPPAGDVAQQAGHVPPAGGGPSSDKPRSFHATADVPAATAKMRLVELAEELVSVLASDPNATVKISVEVSADFPDGASESMKRAVSENARSLGIKKADWE